MSASSLTERPIFASEENEYLTPDKPPISRLAIVTLCFGVISLIALFNFDLVALPILTITLAIASYIFLSSTKSVRGQSLVLMGLGLGMISGISSYTSTRMRDQYLYDTAQKMAVDFLGVLAQNKLLEAYELTRPEAERAVAGTSLEEAYKLMPELSREAIDGFKRQAAVQMVADLGPSAKWEFDGGVRVRRLEGTSVQVVVRMVNRADGGGQTVDVTMTRSYHAGIGAWHVVSVT